MCKFPAMPRSAAAELDGTAVAKAAVDAGPGWGPAMTPRPEKQLPRDGAEADGSCRRFSLC